MLFWTLGTGLVFFTGVIISPALGVGFFCRFPVWLWCVWNGREMSRSRERVVCLQCSHLAVPKAFSIGVCFSLFPVLTCSHFHKSRQIKSPFKANYVESLKLFLGHFSICAVSFLGSLLDLCVQHRFKIMNAKQNRAPFTRKMHTSWAKIIGKVTCSRLWLQRSSTVHALVEIITKTSS